MEQLRQAPKDGGAKELTPRERAEARTKELLSGGFSAEDSAGGHDDFYVDLDIIPEGWSYEWKSWQTLGMDLSSHHIHLRKQGWETVPRTRHPELMPVGSTENAIIRKGMILMERPLVITEEVRRIQTMEARKAVKIKEDQLRSTSPGLLDPKNEVGPLAKISKSFEQMEIPE